MKLTTQLSIPIKLNVLGKPFYYKEIKIGKITDSYIENNKLWVVITLNAKKIKEIWNNVTMFERIIKWVEQRVLKVKRKKKF